MMYFRRHLLLLALLPWSAEAFGSSHYLSQIEGPAKKKPTSTSASYAPGTTVPSDALVVGGTGTGTDRQTPPSPPAAEPPRGMGGSYLESLQQRDPAGTESESESFSVASEPPAAAGRFQRVRRWLGSQSEPPSPPSTTTQLHQQQWQQPPHHPVGPMTATAAVSPVGDYLAFMTAMSKRLPEYEHQSESHDRRYHEYHSLDRDDTTIPHTAAIPRAENTVFASSQAAVTRPMAAASASSKRLDAVPQPFERVNAIQHSPPAPTHPGPSIAHTNAEARPIGVGHGELDAEKRSVPRAHGTISNPRASSHVTTFHNSEDVANAHVPPAPVPGSDNYHPGRTSSLVEFSSPSSFAEATASRQNAGLARDEPKELSAPPALFSLAKSIQMSKKPIMLSALDSSPAVPPSNASMHSSAESFSDMGHMRDDSIETDTQRGPDDKTMSLFTDHGVSSMDHSKSREARLNTVSEKARKPPRPKRGFATLEDIGLVLPPEPAASYNPRPQKSEKKFATLADIGLIPPEPLTLQQSDTQLKHLKTPATLKDIGLLAPMPFIDTDSDVIVGDKTKVNIQETIDLSSNVDVKIAIATPSTEKVTKRRTLEERFNALVQNTRRVTRATTVESQQIQHLKLPSKETNRLHRAPAAVIADISEKTVVQGDSLRTWSFTKPTIERIHVSLKTNGRPLNAEIDLWRGPEHVPFKVRVYGENGKERPFSAVIETPVGPNTLSVRNTGQFEFPLSANVVPDEDNTSGSLPAARTATFESGPATIHGGALKTYVFDASVQSVQVLLKSDGLPINATIELMQGPSNSKQSVQVFSEEGSDRPFFMVIETPGNGNVVRVTNASPIEFPLHAQVEPYSIGQALSPIEPIISGDVVIPEDDVDNSDNSGFLSQLSKYGKKRWLGRR